ncbi:hypothetical protein QR685DRAFT_571415 [Neurospora intermedia]|uniref:Uncharacterized protein n=1 Tax=Neurospora intermedia TaxID=5142 RepID=A0ABR3DC69_NEUIN
MNSFLAHPPDGHLFTPRAGTHHGDAGQAALQPGLQHSEPPSGNIISLQISSRNNTTASSCQPPRSSEDIQARSELSSKLGVGSSSVELF